MMKNVERTLVSYSSIFMIDTKFALILIVTVLLNTVSFSQTPTDSCKFEIGLGTPYFPGTFGGRTPAPLVSLKAIQNKNALRAGFIYDLTASRPFNDYSYFLINIGYERRLFLKKSKLFLGLDACYLSRFNKDSSDPTNNSTFYHLGIGPVIGYLYKISKRFSLHTEVGLFYGYGENKYYKIGIITYSNSGGFFTSHRAIGLNLAYHLK